jgi:ribosomal protein S18 acetylase RimI-like enzyme
VVQIAQAESPEQIEQVRRLFVEYAESLGFSLCFQNFDKELARLPGDYAPPSGRSLLASVDDAIAGCVALHQLHTADTEDRICEMKRLFVRPEFRGHRLGRKLIDAVIAEARAIGYRKMRLDTVAGVMDSAIALYRAYGFREIAPYCENPIPGALYFELILPSTR